MKRRILTIFMALALTAAILPGAALAANYPDVGAGSWCKPYIDRCTDLGIINGYENGYFLPDQNLRRGEFIKMLACSASLSYTQELPYVHWSESYWAMLSEAGVLAGLDIPCTYDALQQDITRYEMAVMIANFLTIVRGESTVDGTGAESVIPDLGEAPAGYRDAVIQVYGKGIINGLINTDGVVDGSFCGWSGLTRAQAAAVMIRLVDTSARTPVDFGGSSAEGSVPADGNPYRLADAPNGTTPFALWARQTGLLGAYGTTAAFNELFFGSADKSYFTSAADAAPYMMDVTVNVWKLGSDGGKYASTMTLTVHKYLAADVYDIFQQIFNDPEQFPINSAGGARFSDTMRHAWGAAIDLNYNENCECNTSSGSLSVTCGSGWWPLGMDSSSYAGSLTGPSPYSISPTGSVVKAFADYGWGWGGSWTGTSRDFMHFSILSSGG